MRTLACLAALFALCAHAEVYKWVDEKGQTQYGETPPAGEGVGVGRHRPILVPCRTP